MMMWSGMAEGSNSPAQLQAMFHAPNIVNRGDPRLPDPVPSTITPQPSDPESTPNAKALLVRLSSSTGIAAGIAEFTVDGPQTSAVAEQIRTAVKDGRLPILRWTPQSPTGASVTAQLTDFEWDELLKSGTALHERWLTEVDAVVPLLQQLNKENIAVVWSPLPEANSPNFWWGGRPGPDGSQALFRELAERLTSQHEFHHLVWMWEPTMISTPPGGPRRTSLEDFYPGPIGVDAVMLDVEGDAALHGFGTRAIAALAGVKPVGVRSSVPLANANPPGFAWAYSSVPSSTSLH